MPSARRTGSGERSKRYFTASKQQNPQFKTQATKLGTKHPIKPSKSTTSETPGASAMPTNEESQGFFPIDNTSIYATSLTQQVQAILNPLPGEEIPEAFERFSQRPLEDQLSIVAPESLSGGGQKGGALLDYTKEVILGAVKVHIKPFWQTIVKQGKQRTKTTSNTLINYLQQVKEKVYGAGLRTETGKANLKSVLYGLGVLVMAYNTGIFHYLPELGGHFMDLMSYVAYQMADLILPAIGAVGVVREAAVTAYRYRDFPYGAYGVYSALTAPFFSSAYVVAEAEFQTINPGIGATFSDVLEHQKQDWLSTMKEYKKGAIANFKQFKEQLEPLKLLISALITGFDKLLSDSLSQTIGGLEIIKRDIDKRAAYIDYLRNVGAELQKSAEQPELQAEQPELQAALAELNNETIGALTLGVGLATIGEIGIQDKPSENDVMDAAAGLLALVDDAAPIAMERLNAAANKPTGVPAGVPASTLHESEIAAAARLHEMSAGKPRRRRHRKTAKKSHKKKHTKKHKRKTTKTKKGKKSKRHTKRRS